MTRINNKKEETLFFERMSEKLISGTKESLADLLEFRKSLDLIDGSKKTHYHQLDEAFKPIHNYVSELLKKYGFVNGNKEANKDNVNVQLIWCLYGNLDCFSYSRFYDEIGEECAIHHASAYARIYVIKKELDFFFDKNKDKIKLL